MKQNTTVFLACVANVSDRGFTQKSGRSGKGEEAALFLPSLPTPSLCFALVLLCRRTREETLATQAAMF